MKLTFLFIILIVFVIPSLAQKEKQENTVCSELKNASLTVAVDEILVAGEVNNPAIRKVSQQISTLSEYIAASGGIRKETAASKNILVFRCSSATGTAENTIFTNYRKIQKRIEPDLKLKGGDIIIVQNDNIKIVPSILPAFDDSCFGCGNCPQKHKP